MEILHLLWLPGVPYVEEEEEEQQGVERRRRSWWRMESGIDDEEKADGGRRGAWEREKDVNKIEKKKKRACDSRLFGTLQMDEGGGRMRDIREM